jgi:hypothetical protein
MTTKIQYKNNVHNKCITTKDTKTTSTLFSCTITQVQSISTCNEEMYKYLENHHDNESDGMQFQQNITSLLNDLYISPIHPTDYQGPVDGRKCHEGQLQLFVLYDY